MSTPLCMCCASCNAALQPRSDFCHKCGVAVSVLSITPAGRSRSPRRILRQQPADTPMASEVELVRTSFNVDAHDSERLSLALEAIRALTASRVKEEAVGDTSVHGFVEIAKVPRDQSAMRVEVAQGPVNKLMRDDILRMTKGRDFYKRLDPAQGGRTEREWRGLVAEIRISDSKLRQTHGEISPWRK